MIDLGSGSPVILIPGIQGRWEWMRPAIDALAARGRVISYALCGEPGSGCTMDDTLGFDSHIAQLDAVIERAGLESAALCGISYGGLVALHYAAQRPKRVRGLVLVSTPSPAWTPDPRVRGYMRTPRLRSPLFVFRSPARLYPEITAAVPDPWTRLTTTAGHLARVARAPFFPTRMVARLRLFATVDFGHDCAEVACPTLVVTGEPHLDRVVPVPGTLDYLRLIPGARHQTIERTGHIGFITRPARFAEAVGGFVDEQIQATPFPARRHA